MLFIKEAVDEVLEDSQRGWSYYFDKKGEVQGVQREEDRVSYPTYLDFYQAIGCFVGKEAQLKYTKKARFFALFEALQQPSILFALLIDLISLALAFITQGEGWPEWIATLAMILGMGPFFGYMSFRWFVQAWMDIYFENAYYAELGNKRSSVMAHRIKRAWNWTFPISMILFILLGIYSSWLQAVTLLVLILSVLFISLIEGFLLLLIGKIWSVIRPKKKEIPAPQLSPLLASQVKTRFKMVYDAFRTGDYTKAYEQFDRTQRTADIFQQEIQNFLTENQQERFNLPNLDESELDISILEVNDSQSEATLFLWDSKAEESSVFYLVCNVFYDDETVQQFELIELGY